MGENSEKHLNKYIFFLNQDNPSVIKENIQQNVVFCK
jgi:hypothetical protein